MLAPAASSLPRSVHYCSPAAAHFCAVKRSHNHTRTLDATNAWIVGAVRNLRRRKPGLWPRVQARVAELSTFTAGVFPAEVFTHPVFYPFGGADLVTAHGLFPFAREIFLQSSIRAGRFACFLSAQCSHLATNSVVGFFDHWLGSNTNMSWAGTGTMEKVFVVGALPTLLVMMHILMEVGTPAQAGTTSDAPVDDFFLGHDHNPDDDDPERSNYWRVTWRGCTAQFSYLASTLDQSRFALLENSTLPDAFTVVPWSDRLVQGMRNMSHDMGIGERPRITLMKAGSHAEMLVDNGVARWVLQTSVATLQDEAGLRPHAYSHRLVTQGLPWVARPYGEFDGFIHGYMEHRDSYAARAAERAELRKFFAGAARLPFAFGYQHDGAAKQSSLIAAWKKEVSAATACDTSSRERRPPQLTT